VRGAAPGFAGGSGRPLPPAASGPAYITGIASDSTTGGYFHDQYGQPRFLMMDNPWAIIFNAGEWNGGDWRADMSAYLTSKQAQGYTGAYCSAIGNLDNDGSYNNGNTWDNVPPFTGGGHPDAGLNNAYWQRVDYFISTAAACGITVLLNIAYTADGSSGNGNFASGAALDPATTTAAMYADYGTAVAQRYASAKNLIWMFGNDYYATVETQFGEIWSAVTATGDTHAMSVHVYPESDDRYDFENTSYGSSGSGFAAANAQWMWVYTYNVTYFGIEQSYGEHAAKGVPMLFAMWGDGFFFDVGGLNITNDQMIRQMAWWTLASGGRGMTGTSNDVWPWSSVSLSDSQTQNWYANVAGKVRAAYEALPGWHRLVPDTSSALVTAGRGTRSPGIASGSLYDGGTDNYVAASRTPDTGGGSQLAVIYGAKAWNITIDQTKMASSYTPTWIDPATGAAYAGTKGSTYNSGAADGSKPVSNSQGDPDWVLALKA